MNIPEIIGRNIRARRLELDMTAVVLGEKMGRVVSKDGKPWPRQTVYMMESGDRAMVAIEVAAVAEILGVTVPDLFLIPKEADTVEAGTMEISWSTLEPTKNHATGILQDLHLNAEELRSLSVQLSDNYEHAISRSRAAAQNNSEFHEWLLRRHTDATEQQAEALAKKHRIAKDSPEIQALLKDHPSPAMQAAADALNLDAHDWVQVEPSADDRASKKYFVGKDVLNPGSGEQKPNPNNSEVSSEWIDAEG